MGFNGANEIRIKKNGVFARIKWRIEPLSNFKVELSDLHRCKGQIFRASENKMAQPARS